MKVKYKGYKNPYYTNFAYAMIYGDSILNIFSDASMRKIGYNTLATCYGSIAVCKDNIIDSLYKLNSECTTPAAEMRGIRLSLDLAERYKYNFRQINIFSDSQVAIFGLRDYFNNWLYNPEDNNYYLNKDRWNKQEPIKNQSLYIECLAIINDIRQTTILNLLHQKGHVESGIASVKNAAAVFKKSNYVDGEVSYDVIRYISTYNNCVDENSRSLLRRTNVYDNNYHDPISFVPIGLK